MRCRFLVVALFGLTCVFAGAQTPSTRPARGDTVVCSTIIHAPADEIFECFTTPEGIVKAWSVAQAKVDFRVGGQIRTAYTTDVDLDSDRCIVNTILAYEPGRMLAMKATPPAGAPDWLLAICESGWSVITLDPVSRDSTRVTVAGMGYGQGELFDKAYAFFERGNAATLELMRRKLGRTDAEATDRATRAIALFKAAAERGGVWTAEQQLGGKPFRGRIEFRPVLDGRFVEARGSIGDDKAIHPHAVMICGIDPSTGAAVYEQCMETGDIARGTMITLEDGRTVATERHSSLAARSSSGGASGQPESVRVGPPPAPGLITYEFTTDDQCIMRMWRTPMADGEPIITVNYRRVAPSAS